jgi:hypothetical protein
MNGTTQLTLDVVEIDLGTGSDLVTLYINVHDNSLSRKWLAALTDLLHTSKHLEKNYCFLGFADGPRNGAYILDQINQSIQVINASAVDYLIDDHFTVENSVLASGAVNHEHFNQLHSYFEDLQGTAHNPSRLYAQADPTTRWHIRQLNLLCHEFESWQLSWLKKHTAPEWLRPSQLMCWLGAPRFALDAEDFELFGINTINRTLGGVYLGVNKAVGKHHYEVFCDEGRDSRIGELVTATLSAQTLAAGDFDIEWGVDPSNKPWQRQQLADFRSWLVANGFDPEDKTLTIGHPQVGQVDLLRSFGTEDPAQIWAKLNTRLNVSAIRTTSAQAEYPYNWTDSDYVAQQIQLL